ncbi:MAG TPA: hypothetical protein PLM20_05280 [Syntrophomonadaceae bacterium]|nr:hypothetical protein [Syntrophomonadaceae bacterium]HQA07437.1 hypothetical protein [Syntrophomonadaceae bacterium]HQE23296.1 hypothetical protein [Syntrophomonadaceae bacterium]
MRKKNPFFPRPVLKSLVNDIKTLVTEPDGRLFLLEIIEEIPFDLRPAVMESLSSFYEPEMSAFFHLMKAEFGSEMEALCNRALEKYSLAGLDISPPQFFKGTFYKAYATCSRHTSRLAVDVAWDIGGPGVYVECFYLAFNGDGVHSFFMVEDMPLSQYTRDRELLTDMVEITFEEACALIYQAYQQNIIHMTRPALGKFLYQKYLSHGQVLTPDQVKDLTRRLSSRLGPRQLVNSFFRAIRERDWAYLDSIVAPEVAPAIRRYFHLLHQIVEGQVEEVLASRTVAQVHSYAIAMEDRSCYRERYQFQLERGTNNIWTIKTCTQLDRTKIDNLSDLNPFNRQIYCRVYEITDLDGLFEALERVDDIRQVEELPYGLHMRVTYHEEDLSQGVSMLSGVIADLIVNGDEFVIACQDFDTLMDFHHLLLSEKVVPVSSRGEYQVNLMTLYTYLSGQYLHFEDILLIEEEDYLFEDGLRFISARYLIKDRDKVEKRIKDLHNLHLKISDDYQVFYQMESRPGGAEFFVEYVLGSGWVTVSTFGEQDMARARRCFEERMFDSLEFDGMEVRENGLFDVLTSTVKKQHPELEQTLKEIYLNKWYYSQLSVLSGMSPWEASQTEEGTRLLWTLFKRIKQRENSQLYQTSPHRVHVKEYIRKVQQQSLRKPL